MVTRIPSRPAQEAGFLWKVWKNLRLPYKASFAQGYSVLVQAFSSASGCAVIPLVQYTAI
jgi:hypothetical protein